MGSLVRYPLRMIIKSVVIHPIASIALVVFVGVGFVLYTGRAPQPLMASAGQTNSGSHVVAKGNLPAPSSTEDFMNGQATFDGTRVWNALSDDLHSSLSAAGNTQDTIQQQLDQYKQEGRHITDYAYVGGYLGVAKSFYFYVASIKQPELGGQADQVFFAFTVDGHGKIMQVQ